MSRQVILTDEAGATLGMADIMDAHTGNGLLHKAFSVYIFSPDKAQILIQQRSEQKMLFPLFWANTCCSHPFEDEPAIAAGQRRLQEECGFTTELEEAGSIVYRAEDPHGNGVEHEHVTLLTGTIDEHTNISPNPDEIARLEWRNIDELTEDMDENPDAYAPWFHLGLEQILAES